MFSEQVAWAVHRERHADLLRAAAKARLVREALAAQRPSSPRMTGWMGMWARLFTRGEQPISTCTACAACCPAAI